MPRSTMGLAVCTIACPHVRIPASTVMVGAVAVVRVVAVAVMRCSTMMNMMIVWLVMVASIVVVIMVLHRAVGAVVVMTMATRWAVMMAVAMVVVAVTMPGFKVAFTVATVTMVTLAWNVVALLGDALTICNPRFAVIAEATTYP